MHALMTVASMGNIQIGAATTVPYSDSQAAGSMEEPSTSAFEHAHLIYILRGLYTQTEETRASYLECLKKTYKRGTDGRKDLL